jgi:hypothetical protein
MTVLGENPTLEIGNMICNNFSILACLSIFPNKLVLVWLRAYGTLRIVLEIFSVVLMDTRKVRNSRPQKIT